jgi:transposase
MNSIRKVYEDNEVFVVLNAPACPDLNAIETCFSQVKLKYKQQRLQTLVNKRDFDQE